jgi:hypothetical protein
MILTPEKVPGPVLRGMDRPPFFGSRSSPKFVGHTYAVGMSVSVFGSGGST